LRKPYAKSKVETTAANLGGQLTYSTHCSQNRVGTPALLPSVEEQSQHWLE
jgi:hypothetical protein